MSETLRELPKVNASMYLEVHGQAPIRYNHEGEVPKDIMDAYEQVVGNGLAKVTVGTDMAIKDFGTGAGASCFITLSCNQDGQTINQAVQLAAQLSRSYAHQNRQMAENELQTIIQQKGTAQFK